MSQLPTPSTDIAQLTDRLAQAWAVTVAPSIAQCLMWCEAAGLFTLMAGQDSVTLDDLCARSRLNRGGADALVCVLASLELVHRRPGGGVVLSELAREYLVETSPYYVGHGLYIGADRELPPVYRTDAIIPPVPPDPPVKRTWSSRTWSIRDGLQIQHSRNLPPSVVAARSGEFDGVEHLVDIGGGSGAFSIPLALDHPAIRITLVDLPEVVPDIAEFLRRYGVAGSIELVGMDILRDEWQFAGCDAMLFGNMFHAFPDDICRSLARNSFDALAAGGKVWLHEVLFNETRDGPLLAALWNINMTMRGTGARQRTASELIGLLHEAGFEACAQRPTSGHFCLVSGTKPRLG